MVLYKLYSFLNKEPPPDDGLIKKGRNMKSLKKLHYLNKQ